MPTAIEWAEETWNPITGCSPISEGCQNCYAERKANRLANIALKQAIGGPGGRLKRNGFEKYVYAIGPNGKWNGAISEDHRECDSWDKPLHWRKPRRVFVCSMGDLFHPEVDRESIDHIMAIVISDCPQHTFLFLTKRPEVMAERLSEYHLPKNLWIGTTMELQRHEGRLYHLKQINAAVRFVSIEPMLGPINLGGWLTRPQWGPPDEDHMQELEIVPRNDVVNWVICGGESGPGARPMHPDWVRSLRDQCQAAGTPFLFKQWGEWIHDSQVPDCRVDLDPTYLQDCHSRLMPERHGQERVYRVGKKKAGRLLDGKIWDQYPVCPGG